MKTPITTLMALFFASATQAQLQVNPQLGFTLQSQSADSGVDYKAKTGFQLGCDFRIGERLYFQPGAFFNRNVTAVKYTGGDTLVYEDDVVRTVLKMKAVLGWNLIHTEGFKLRLNAGPTYDILMSVDSKDDKVSWNKDDYAAGVFNLDGGIGVDVWILSAETGVSYGLSNAYSDSGMLKSDSKYFTWYFNVGVVIGNGMD